MKKQPTKYYVLLFLLILFAAPGIAAYLFYENPSWLDASKVNKGVLLNPPIILDALAGQPKWRIIFWSPSACDKACLRQLNILARMRLALGRKLYQVDQWLILGDKAPSLSQETKALLKEIDFQVVQVSAAHVPADNPLFGKARVFLADPHNYLMMRYSSKVPPEDVYKDLRLLLNTTENKGAT